MTDVGHLNIRERRTSDLPWLAAALIEVHRLDGYPVEGVSDPHAWLTNDAVIDAWVAVLDREVVGHVSLSEPHSGDSAAQMLVAQTGIALEMVTVLGRLFVTPPGRGLGLGRRLTRLASSHSESIGRRAVLDVMLKDVAAIRTYESLGWTSLGDFAHPIDHTQSEPARAYASPAINGQVTSELTSDSY